MEPITTVKQALQQIEQFTGTVSEFELPIANTLNDAVGINMAIITDKILQKGWMPNGCREEEGFRVYRYRDMGD